MKTLRLAVLLLAGCAAATVPLQDARLKELEQRKREIATRAKQCVVAAMKHSSDKTVPTSGLDSPTESKVVITREERDKEISKCKSAEAQENEELFSQERKEYVLQAEQERDRNALIPILTTSRPH